MKITKHILLDFNKTKKVDTQTVQCDMNSRFVRASLHHNNSPIDLSDVRVCIMAVKPDGKEIFNDCTVIDAQNGLAEFEITKQMGIVVGEVKCQIKLFGKEKLLSSNIFNLSVSKSLSPNSRDSKDQLNTLVESLNRVDEWDDQFQQKYNGLEEEYAHDITEIKGLIIENDLVGRMSEAEQELAQTNAQLSENINELESKMNAEISDAQVNIALLFQQKLDKNGLISVNQIDKNLGKFDQSYLSDELLQQMVGNTPIHSVPADGSITVEKNAYPTVVGHYDDENLIDLPTMTDNHYVWYQDGNLYNLNTHAVTDYIDVVGGYHYVSNVNEQTAFYDEQKRFISGVTGIGNGGLTIPTNARYMRMSVNKDSLGNVMVSRMKLPRYYYDRKPRIRAKDICGTSYQFIVSVTQKIKIINNKVTFNNVTVFDTINRNYFTLNGEYQLGGGGSCLSLNIVNNDIQVVNYHSTLNNLNENYIVLFVEYGGRYLSNIFTEEQVINLDVKREILVSGRKNADYTTITEAIDDCKKVNTVHPFNIIVDSGVYFESINLYDVDNINLIGVNKHQCVIQNRSANYYKAPLSTNGAGYFENLTFISSSEEDDGAELKSYAMHYDGDGKGVCEFYNCVFKSDNNSAVGIGMRKDETLIFNQCEIIKTDTIPNGMGAFYCHSAQFNGHSNQHIIVKNCDITSQFGAFLTIDDSNTLDGIGEFGNVGGEMDITFINNNFYSGTYGNSNDGVMLRGVDAMNDNCIVGSVVLHPRSFGNNVELLNK